MTLTLSLELPPFVTAVWSEDGKTVEPAPEGFARWSPPKAERGTRQPPALGDLIAVGRWGAAVVTGYFVEDGWLGVRSTLLEPPADWFKGREPGSEHNVCTFAPEFEPLAHAEGALGALTLTWRDHPNGPAFRVYDLDPDVTDWRAFEALLKGYGFEYDGRHAAQVADRYRHGEANAFALAARLRAKGYTVAHAGCYGEAGPKSAGLKTWWKE